MTNEQMRNEFDDEFDDDFDNGFEDDFDENDDFDDEDDVEDDEAAGELAGRFPGNAYRIVNLSDLGAAENGEEEEPVLPPPTLTLADLLQRLLANPATELPLSELALLSDLPRAGVDMVRRHWPHLPVGQRRTVVEMLVAASSEMFALQLGPFLRVTLDDEDAGVRRLAIEGLWEEQSVDLLGRLVHLLETDDDTEVRAAAASALGPYVLAGELDELDAALAMRTENALMAAVTNSDEPLVVQCRALESIAYAGEFGVRQLIEDAYYSPEDELRLSSLVAMGRSADVRWRRPARAELSNPAPAMRAEAAIACGELEAKAALTDLLDLLQDDVQDVRLAAIFALGRIGGSKARHALQAIADGPDAVEAGCAKEALEEMAFYVAADALDLPLLDEEEEDLDAQDAWDYDRDDGNDDDLGEYA